MSFELLSLETIEELARQYGYATVLLGIMVENMGIPIPGETITLAAGFLAGNDELSYWGVLGSAITGAVIGDSCGYWVGYYGGWALLTRLGQIFKIEEKQLQTVKKRFSENAPQAVFLGRFVALLRIFAGPLAGIAQMPYPKFLLYNIAGAALWASTTVTAAYFIGRILSLKQLVLWISQLGVLALLIVIGAIAFTIWMEHRIKPAESVESPSQE
jgi:membrane protein DedA with SNARE-associated domain